MKKLFIVLSLLLATASAAFAGNQDAYSTEAKLPLKPIPREPSVMSGTVVTIGLAAYLDRFQGQLPMFIIYLDRTYTVPVTIRVRNNSTGSSFTTVIEAGNNSGWVVIDNELGNWSIYGSASSELMNASGNFTVTAPVGAGYIVGSVVLN